MVVRIRLSDEMRKDDDNDNEIMGNLKIKGYEGNAFLGNENRIRFLK